MSAKKMDGKLRITLEVVAIWAIILIVASLAGGCSGEGLTTPEPTQLNFATISWTLAWSDSSLAAGNCNPHVCVPLFGAPYCPICAASKDMPDSTAADEIYRLPNFDWGFGSRGPTN